MRPRLFWAALNYASQTNKDKNKTVLISILGIEDIVSQYATPFLKYIEEDLSNVENIPYKETNNYVRKILRDYKIYEKIY